MPDSRGTRPRVTIARCAAVGAGLLVGAYAACAGLQWSRYGQAETEAGDQILDEFMPEYEIVERHSIRVNAPPEVTLKAACGLELQQSGIIRAIFRMRELVLRGEHHTMPRSLLDMLLAAGWGVLLEVPGRAVALGAVTQPWRANVRFRAIPAEEFGAFAEPGWVKIAVALCADAAGGGESIARTETRAVATDAAARRRFRRYWALVAPGVDLIRHFAIRMVKAEAEERCSPAYDS